MNRWKRIGSVILGLSFLNLILDGQTAASGIRNGLQLCMEVLIPALFPLSMLSVLIANSVLGRRISFMKPLAELCRIPDGTESLILVGWMGGYPIGAQNVAIAQNAGQLSKADAARMAVICNNCGPSFLFGMLSPLFGDKLIPWLLWLIQILSSIVIGIIIPGGSRCRTNPTKAKPITAAKAIRIATTAMANICACVVLFRMILEFLDKWILHAAPDLLRILICGMTELSNGCILLAEIPDPNIRFVIAAFLLTFGGSCVWMQTASVCSGLMMNHYLLWKLFQGLISMFLAVLILLMKTRPIPAILTIISGVFLLLVLGKKDIAFSKPLLYNKSSAK